MPTDVQCALLSGCAYYDNRHPLNRFPIPQGWDRISRYPESVSGFEAAAFENKTTNEIVISFAGLDGNDDFIPSSIDFQQCTTLCLGETCADQLKEAAAYYMAIKKANFSATITFTGQSMGGGLAALMAVLFDKKAVVFDEAPFRASAKEIIRDELVTYLRTMYSDAELELYASGLMDYSDSQFAWRKFNVQGEYVKGEINSSLPGTEIGSRNVIDPGPTDIGSFSLHSIELITAFEWRMAA